MGDGNFSDPDKSNKIKSNDCENDSAYSGRGRPKTVLTNEQKIEKLRLKKEKEKEKIVKRKENR